MCQIYKLLHDSVTFVSPIVISFLLHVDYNIPMMFMFSAHDIILFLTSCKSLLKNVDIVRLGILVMLSKRIVTSAFILLFMRNLAEIYSFGLYSSGS